MAYDNQSFIQKLRMNSIFPPENSGNNNPNPLIGMPNFFAGRQQQQTGLDRVANFDSHIGKPIVPTDPSQRPDQQLNYEYKPVKSDEYGTDILMGTTEEDKQKRVKELLGVKDAGKQANAVGTLAVKQQLANVAKFKAEHPGLKTVMTKGGNVMLMNPLTGEMTDTGVDTGTLTEQDKIQLTADEAQDLENTKQTGRMELANTKGSQALEQIGARVRGQQDIANTNNAARSSTPAQQKALQQAAITQIQTTRSDLAQYLTKDPTTGQIEIDENTPLDKLSEIQKMISPKTFSPEKFSQPRDIELPAKGSKSKTSEIKSDPLGIR